MESSKLNIINTALSGFAGIQISSLLDQSPNGIMALKAFDTAFRVLTARREWSFLLKDVMLDNPEETPKDIEFSFRFPEPTDVDYIYSVERNPFSDTLLFYYAKYIYNTSKIPVFRRKKPFILTNFSPVYMLYQTNAIDSVFVPSGIFNILVLLMRSDLAISIKSSVSLSQLYMQKAEHEIRIATSKDFKNIQNIIHTKKDPYNLQENTGFKTV